MMMQRSNRIYVLAHADKLGRRPFHAWAPIPADATLVTDRSATTEQIRAFEVAGVNVVHAPASVTAIDSSG
jgi:DeoR/GlpR family transcriptional regulator of sugar metabolism